MVVAMMLPLAAPGVAHVAFASFRSRQARSVAGFVAVYLGLWVAAIMLIDQTIGGPLHADRPLALFVVFAAAAVWQLVPLKRRALLHCHAMPTIGARGWRADLSCMRFGATLGVSCIASCWLLMAAASAAGDLAAMGAIFVVQLAERFGPPTRVPAGGAVVGTLGLLELATHVGIV